SGDQSSMDAHGSGGLQRGGVRSDEGSTTSVGPHHNRPLRAAFRIADPEGVAGRHTHAVDNDRTQAIPAALRSSRLRSGSGTFLMLPFFIGVMSVGTDSLILSALLDPMAREFGMIGPQAGRAAAAQGVALAVTAPVA